MKPPAIKEIIRRSVRESVALKERFFQENEDLIINAARVIADIFNDGGKLLLFGNGGSATDASHIAAEFVNRFKRERPGLPAIALTTDMAVITSIANDYNYSDIFSRQLRSLGNEGDVVLAISTSGGSRNVLKAMDIARKKGMKRIAFTGSRGGKFAEKADFSFVVPSEDTPRVQEIHIMLGHMLCELVEGFLFELPGHNEA